MIILTICSSTTKLNYRQGDIAPVATKDNLGVKVSVNNATPYKFHYSFADSKLYLYGDFSQLYEILDFNNKEGMQLYLFYQSNFYKINESQTNVAPLLKVNDPSNDQEIKRGQRTITKISFGYRVFKKADRIFSIGFLLFIIIF